MSLKPSLLESLYSSVFFSKKHLITLIVPVLVWAGSYYLRENHLSRRICFHQPERCTADHVFVLDRWAVGRWEGMGEAKNLSDITQNSAAFFAILGAAAFEASKVGIQRVSPLVALSAFGVDLFIFVETALWNGALNEVVRLIFQRPRPYVYQDPTKAGARPIDYTSFYSGHTSFATAIGIAFFLLLMGRGARAPILLGAGAVSGFLALSTGILRVMGGQHFLTDIVFSFLFGALVALTVARLHRRSG